MKKIAFAVILVALGICAARVGGPDAFGYMFKDSAEPEITFSWLAHTGDTALIFDSSDDGFCEIPLPFAFVFYGEAYETLYVSTNGVAGFAAEYVDEYSNLPIPNETAPNAIAAVFWDDLRDYEEDSIATDAFFTTGGAVGSRYFAVTWENYFGYGFYDDVITFQVIFYESNSGTNGRIVYQYFDVTLEGSTKTLGGEATVGIENASGTVGLQYSSDTEALAENLRIEFEVMPPVPHDLGLLSIVSPLDFVSDDSPIMPTCIVRNHGTASASGLVRCDISNDDEGIVYTDDLPITLASSTSDTLEFPEWAPSFPLDHTVTFTIVYAEDERPENNIQTQLFSTFVHPEHDVMPETILMPLGTVLDMRGATPSCAVWNNGRSNEASVTVECRIETGTGTTVYEETLLVSLDAWESATVTFPAWSPHTMGAHTVYFVTTLLTDLDVSNDTLYEDFEVVSHMSHDGPDGYGYEWFDSYFSGAEAPAFSPIEILATTPLPLTGDDSALVIPLPFTFSFYGVAFDSIAVSTNGYLAFPPQSATLYDNARLPATTMQGIIAPFWDDMQAYSDSTPPSEIYAFNSTIAGVPCFHIVWQNLRFHSEMGFLTVEARLFENGEIVFQYAGISDAASARLAGNSATIGLNAPTGLTGILYEYNAEPAGNLIFDNFAIRFASSSEPVDITAPVIEHDFAETLYLCDYLDGIFGLAAAITDMRGVTADTIVWVIDGVELRESADSVLADHYYLFFSDLPTFGSTIEYYFIARDAAGNRGLLPAGAPAERFTAYVANPHNGTVSVAGSHSAWFIDNMSNDFPPFAAPAYIWVELDPDFGGVGTQLTGITDEWLSDAIDLGTNVYFNSPAGLRTAPAIKICSNGWITFDLSTTDAFANGSFPESPVNDVFAAFWTDITPTPPTDLLPEGEIFYGISGDYFVVEWKNFYIYGDESGDALTFELRLPTRLIEIGSDIYENGAVAFNLLPFTAVDIATCGNYTDEISIAYLNAGEPKACLPVIESFVQFYLQSATHVSEPNKPAAMYVGLPMPNPFNSAMEIAIGIDHATYIKAELYTIDGKLVQTLFDGKMDAGVHKLNWNADKDASSGVYFARISLDGKTFTRRLIYLK